METLAYWECFDGQVTRWLKVGNASLENALWSSAAESTKQKIFSAKYSNIRSRENSLLLQSCFTRFSLNSEFSLIVNKNKVLSVRKKISHSRVFQEYANAKRDHQSLLKSHLRSNKLANIIVNLKLFSEDIPRIAFESKSDKDHLKRIANRNDSLKYRDDLQTSLDMTQLPDDQRPLKRKTLLSFVIRHSYALE